MTSTCGRPLREVSVRAVKCPDFIASFDAGRRRGTAFYRTGGGTDGEQMLALGEAIELLSTDRATVGGAAAGFFDALTDLAGTAEPDLRMVGWMAFDPGDPRPHSSDFGRCRFFVPQITVLRRGDETRAIIAATGDKKPEAIWSRWCDIIERPERHHTAASDAGSEDGDALRVRWPDDERFRRSVRRVIADEAVEKVVLARRAVVEASLPIDVAEVLRVLGRDFLSCTRFAIAAGGRTPVFVGATPERLVAIEGRKLSTMALAGTTRCDDADEESRRVAEQALVDSTKDRVEHRYVIDDIRQRLAPICKDLDVGKIPTIRRLHNVSHLETTISARLRAGSEPAEVVDSLHPTPAVCGVPTDRARVMIREHEGFDRGPYAGTLGWIDADGNAEFDVALRCGVLDGRRATLFAGAGITADSDPEVEVAETRRKIGAIKRALAEVCRE